LLDIMRKFLAPLTGIASFVLASCGPAPAPDTYAAWEDWEKECALDYSCTVATAPDGTENTFRFEYRKADYDGTRRTKSAELTTALYHLIPGFRDSREDWIGFRLMLPEQQAFSEGKHVMLFQTHGYPDFKDGENWRYPPVCLTLEDSKFYLSYVGDSRAVSPSTGDRTRLTDPGEKIELGTAEPGVWYSFVIHDVYKQSGKGMIEVDFDGSYLRRDGIVLGYDDKQGPYWKMGVYASEEGMEPDVAMAYFANVKVMVGRGSYADVVPPGMPEADADNLMASTPAQ